MFSFKEEPVIVLEREGTLHAFANLVEVKILHINKSLRDNFKSTLLVVCMDCHASLWEKMIKTSTRRKCYQSRVLKNERGDFLGWR